MSHPSPRLTAALAALRAGKPILLQDDTDRENEADLIAIAEIMTLETMVRMIRDGSGIVCLCMQADELDAIALNPMVRENQSRHQTAFMVSIEAASGVSTGVSAADRLTTIQAALESDTQTRRIVSPGHVFPLRAHPDGLRARRGHTEGTVELARLAGFRPAGVLCELMNPDGTMARGKQVADYAREHQLSLLSIEEIVAHLSENSHLIPRLAEQHS